MPTDKEKDIRLGAIASARKKLVARIGSVQAGEIESLIKAYVTAHQVLDHNDK